MEVGVEPLPNSRKYVKNDLVKIDLKRIYWMNCSAKKFLGQFGSYKATFIFRAIRFLILEQQYSFKYDSYRYKSHISTYGVDQNKSAQIDVEISKILQFLM
ncbi:Hypothetical_protein [Hexamita inflata]|uniref:Hypothetical_protein n=1 Tax=Hexamita inflata TaxID=28002 RepID=A0AA86PTR9_9EUKA|nr:Hypothetical protein HINF_LOCUS33306 [Hexamita inflata]